MRRLIMATTVLGLLLTGCSGDTTDAPATGSTPTGPITYTLTGTIEASECGGGYEIANASVEIRDETDLLIGAATTGSDIHDGYGCRTFFTVTDLPQAKFYQVAIGTHGGPSYTFEELEAAAWKLTLSLD